jgi:glycosyltransferase involved in cell wall biosynthesis
MTVRVLYLYSEVMGYTMATIRALLKKGAEVHVVYKNRGKLTPYQPPVVENLYFYPRSSQTDETLEQISKKVDPQITVVSGWVDKEYLKVARKLRTGGKIVICGLDGQWHGSLRQRMANVLGRFHFFSHFFSHAWVAGVYQYEYARELGFAKKEIIFDLYSADLDLFSSAYCECAKIKEKKYPHRFLFVGRLDLVKGLDVLLEAWRELGGQRKDWELHLIGNGSLKDELIETPSIVVKDFLQPDDLVHEISSAGCFVLPSRREPWGVVVHEFAAAGLPLICSDVVGAAASFLIDGSNGYLFKSLDFSDLSSKLLNIIHAADEDLNKMGQVSVNLSRRITPDTSSANLLSLYKNHT